MGWWYAMAGGASITGWRGSSMEPYCCGCSRIEGMCATGCPNTMLGSVRRRPTGACRRVSSSGMDDHLRAPIGLWVLALIICGNEVALLMRGIVEGEEGSSR